MKILVCAFTVMILVAMCCTEPLNSQEIEPINQWKGKTRSETHIDAAPENGLVTDEATWKELWKKWKPGRAMPEIDFSKDFVLVQQVRGPNEVMVSSLTLKEGNLTFVAGASRMGGPGFGFALLQLSREGVETVQQKPLPEPDQGKDSKKPDSGDKESIRGFKTLSVETSGGIAGLMQIEKIATDGKIVVESTKDGSRIRERQLNAKQLEALREFMESTSWKEVPKAGATDQPVSDNMHYVITMETAAGKFEFEYDAIAAQENETIRFLLQLIAGKKPR